ncbi:SDR family oxidoreductase [Zymobacter sp. IVIA_12111.31 C1]|uniref:SDR family oxidoreductase n=1 Tax=Zymobacter sp. IVIA_12111.31 C1 TaxID=3394854 RepID=UPI0039C23514
MARFEGKRLLVTGATSGIGLAGAVRIAEEGGQIIGTGRNEERLKALRRKLPDSATIMAHDAGCSAQITALVKRVKAVGRLDGLWLNAGYAAIKAVDEVDADHFDAMMAANVRGPVLLMAQLAPLLNDGASVVLTGSTSAYEGGAMASVYAATKGALLSLSRCWASALGERGIRVNMLQAGPIDTDFRHFMAAEARRAFEADVTSRTALKRMGSAEEAAAVALFLLSDESRFVTGSQYAADGGLVMQ